MIEISLPRRRPRSDSPMRARSNPSSRISPSAMASTGGGSSCITVIAVTLLPEPDSPTTPRTLPGAMSKLMPSTAVTIPRGERKRTLRSRTERSGGAGSRIMSDHEDLLVGKKRRAANGATLGDLVEVLHVVSNLARPAHARFDRAHHAGLVRDVLEGIDVGTLVHQQPDAMAVMGIGEFEPGFELQFLGLLVEHAAGI